MGSAEVFGPYVVYEQIGLGGMATVHRAETQGIAGFSKQVALKRMLPSVAADANLVKSFIREARLASHLRHANVAQTFDLGKVGDTYFIAMELVRGRNLRQILKHCSSHNVRMPLPIAMNIVNQIADALDYAHNLCDETGAPFGIIHRDVSPSNVIVSEGGIVKLIDFGIAKASGNMATMSGTIKGKFGYMAPEYLEGFIDARADLFALGVIAHELLSNRPLFQGRDDMDTLFRVKSMTIQPPSRQNPMVPPEIDAIVMTALERDPEKRWQRATALRSALTSETQKLGLSSLNQQVIEWVEHAFEDPEASPEISITGGTTELPRGTPQKLQDVDWGKSAADAETRKAESYDEALLRQSSQDLPTRLVRPSAQISAQRAHRDSGNDPRNDRPSQPPPPTAPASARTQPEQVQAPPQVPMPPVIGGAGAYRIPQPLQPMPPVGPHPKAMPPLPANATAQQPSTLMGVGESAKFDAILAQAPGRRSGAALATTPTKAVTDARTKVTSGRRGASNFLLAVLVLIVAGIAAAVVYFALPYLT